MFNSYRDLEKIGCEKILINTHYLSKIVEDFLLKYKDLKTEIITCYESKLLGTAGTLFFNRHFFKDSRGLLIHADNLTDMDLQCLINAHKERPKGCLMTMLTFDTIDPSSCGIVQVDEFGVVQAFFEKVKSFHGNKANGAIYVFEYEFINFLESQKYKFIDFSKDIIPNLIGKIYTFHTNYNYFDIGTKKSLDIANNIWSKK